MVAACLAAAIFAFDILSSMGIAVAALYIVVLLLSLRFSDARGIVLIAAGCTALTVVGYLIEHAGNPARGPLLRCIVSVLAIAVAGALCVQIRSAQGMLRRSEERYRNIFRSTGVAILEQDWTVAAEICAAAAQDGVSELRRRLSQDHALLRKCLSSIRTIDVNDAARSLVGDLRAGGSSSWAVVSIPETIIAFREILLAYLEGLPSYATETVVRSIDGKRRNLVVTANFQKDRSRPILISAVDVTAQVDAEIALRQSTAELTRVSRIATLGALTASIGHEVNQPLAAVVTNGEAALRWLARDEPNLSEVKLCIEESVGEGRRAAEIVKRLRQLSVKRDVTCELVDINAIVAQVHAMARRDLQEQQVTASLELRPGLPAVAGDAVQLQQVAMNLVNNAIHAMAGRKRKELHMETSLDERAGVRVSISDTGSGISDANLPQLFAPFFTTKKEGMGVGLSISRSIIETHRGRIWAERNEEEGSSFHFMIPFAENARADADVQ